MKNINFDSFNFTDKSTEYRRWIKFSTVFIFIGITFIIILQTIQLYKIYNLKKEKLFFEQKLVNFDTIITEKNNIKKQKDNLESKLKKFQKRSSLESKKFVYTFLTQITNAVPNDLYLHSLDYSSKTGIEIKGYMSDEKAVIAFINNLEKLQFVEKANLHYLKFKQVNEFEQKPEITDNFLHEFFITLKLRK